MTTETKVTRKSNKNAHAAKKHIQPSEIITLYNGYTHEIYNKEDGFFHRLCHGKKKKGEWTIYSFPAVLIHRKKGVDKTSVDVVVVEDFQHELFPKSKIVYSIIQQE